MKKLVLPGITATLVLLIALPVTIYLTLQSTQSSEQTSNTNSTSATSSATAELSYEQDLAQVDEEDLKNHAEELDIDTATGLSEDEIEDLLFMREEEKLAHDVYTALYNEWGLQIFTNISDSEQNHTDSLATLISAYGLDDPYQEGVGVFTNSEFTDLYNQLVEAGSASVEEALKVGALIEDLDIVDLENAMERTENTSITTVYENLQRGSRNHIRSFTSMLSRYGETYEPQYLSVDEYEEIITSAQERGSGSGGASVKGMQYGRSN